jgi:hypothetical protein
VATPNSKQPAARKPRAKKAAASNVVSMANELIDRKLKTSCVAEYRKGLQIVEADPADLEAWGQPVKMAMAIPYFTLDGVPTGFKRIRYLESTLDGFASQTDAKERRYVQPPDTLPQAYFSPQWDWRDLAGDPEQDVWVTEGELKAACCTAMDRPTIGLGGVWSFKSSKASRTIIEELTQFKWGGRRVTIVFDSDAATNPGVAKACNALAEELLHRGARVMVAHVPPTKDGDKQGIDDFALAEGRQATQALLDLGDQFDASQVLHAMNGEVAYVLDPGLIHVYATHQKMRASDFVAHHYANRHITEWVDKADGSRTAKKSSAAKAWLEWPHRGQFDRMTFAPGQGQKVNGNELNTWPGWGVEPKRGPIGPWIKLLDHLFGADKAARQWFERWLALPIQRPGSKMYSAAVVWGVETGTGKSLVGTTVGRIYGKCYTEIGDQELQDDRAEWAENICLVMGDDVAGHEQRTMADRLKKLITQERLRLNKKYVPSYSVPDFINYYFTSNHPDAFFLEDKDRRFFIHEVKAGPLPDDFVDEYRAWMRGDGPAFLMYHFQRLDLGDMKAEGRALQTEAKTRMTEDGMSNLGRWVRQLLAEPDMALRMGGNGSVIAGDLWAANELLDFYVKHIDQGSKAGVAAMNKELKRAGFILVYGGAQVRTCMGQKRLYAVRNADKWNSSKVKGPELAAAYDEKYKLLLATQKAKKF